MSKAKHAVRDAEHAIIEAAISWWRAHRPVSFDLPRHLATPAVNTFTERDERLAKAVAALILAETHAANEARRVVRVHTETEAKTEAEARA